MLVHTAISDVARNMPGAVAVADPVRSITYSELDELTERLAGRLAARAVGPGVIVGLAMQRSVDAVVAVLAVLKAGGAFQPLDPVYPDAHLRRMVQTAGTAVLIADDMTTGLRAGAGLPVVTIDELLAMPGGAAPAAPAPGGLAYVTHTSGSKRQPKAVAVTHHAIAVAASGWLDTYGLRGNPMPHLQYAGFGFDVFIADIARCLLSGGTLVICPPAVRLEPPALAEFISRHEIAFAEFTPALLLLLLEYLELTAAELPSLRVVAVGGEPWYVGTYRRLARAAPNATIINTYGLAEATVDNMLHVGPPPADAADDQLMPLGRPQPGTEIVVVDIETGRPVDAGDGELLIAGACLSVGYLGQPELTTERFIAHPVTAGARALRTGDMVRISPDGSVHYLGRRDDQVKIRGVRVTLGDVESVLASHPGVRRAAAVAVSGRTGAELVAHVVPDGAAPPAGQLRDLVRQQLAAEAVPSQIVFRDSLPVSPNGKIDRAGLGTVIPVRRGSPASAASAADVAAAAWADAVGCERIEPADDFFAMGGDSVAAARVAMRVAIAVDAQVPASALYEHPTFAEFAAYVSALALPAPVISARADPSAHPLGPGQQRLWLLSKLHPGRVTYTVPMIVEMRGDLDREALRQALRDLVARHEPLRTIVVDDTAEPVCRVLAPAPVPVETERASGERDAGLRAASFLRRPFVLSEQLPIRALLISLGPAWHWLVLAIHHIATDGDSGKLILRELGDLYNGARAGRPATLPELTITYGDVAGWQRSALAASHVAGRLDRRLGKLRGCQDRPLALEGRDPERAEGVGARRTSWLGDELAAAARTAARERRTTVFVVLLAAFGEVIARWSGGTDVCVGYPASMREPAPARELVGFFIDTRVAHIDLSGQPSYAELIARVHAEIVAAAASPVPFDVLAEAVAAGRGHRGPLFRVWFNHLGTPEQPPAMDGLATSVQDPPEPPALFDINVYVTEHDHDIRIDLVHDVARCSPDAADELLGQYRLLLAAALAHPGALIRRHRVLTRRAAALPGPADPLRTAGPPDLVKRLRLVARSQPDAVAVRGCHGERTYRDLYDEAGKLARALLSAGVRPADTIAVYPERCANVATAMLAVWEVGGRLLMLDPGYPVARLARYASAARARCLVAVGAAPPGLAVDSLVAVPHTGPPQVLRAAGRASAPIEPGPGYVAFTSGSTGDPVGVIGGLAPIAHFLDWYTAEFALDRADRFALLAGLAHDPLFRDTLTPLWAGGTLCVPTPEEYRSPADLLVWLRDQQVTVIHLTPPLARLLLEVAGASLQLPSLRLVCLAGDTVTALDVTRLSALAPGAQILGGYGTTETPQLVSRRLLAAGQPPALGAGAPGSQLLVLNQEGALCGIGEAGDIIVRSRHLVTRLLTPADQPARLAADAVAGVGRFRTDDLGRYQTDGTIAYLGRSDRTVKVRGFRASPAEVDKALSHDPQVTASVTVPRSGPDGTELVSYVVAAGSAAPRLRARLAGSLPAYLVPAVITCVDRLPLTVNGKVDLAALPPPGDQTSPSPVREGPEGELERQLARLWSVVLGVDGLSMTDNFFDLGGTSLKMLRLHAAVVRGIDDRVTLLSMYQNPSVRALARSMAGHAVAASSRRSGHRPSSDELARRLAARHQAGQLTAAGRPARHANAELDQGP